MSWRSLVVELEAAGAEPLADALLGRGALAVEVEDADAGTAAERPVFDEPGAGASGGWTRARLRALLPADMDAAAVLAGATVDARLACVPPHRVDDLPEEDWVRASQSQFAPIRVSERLWVVPSWAPPPDPSALHIALDPGLAFGTGSHPTTRLCLRWLEAQVRPGMTVLDYGCGSGILAIAAMKLGAAATVGVDVDPIAVRAARANAVANAVTARFLGTDEPLDLRADLVVANILANPLKLLAPMLAGHCRHGGRIALAGLLESQAVEVARAYAPWSALAPFAVEDGWVALEGERR